MFISEFTYHIIWTENILLICSRKAIDVPMLMKFFMYFTDQVICTETNYKHDFGFTDRYCFVLAGSHGQGGC